MRGGTLPPAILCAALAFMLVFAPRRAIGPTIGLLAAALLIASVLPWPHGWMEIVFIGCWASVVVTALLVHLPGGVPVTLALIAGINAGVWAGATIAEAGSLADAARALPCVLLVLPARWLAARGASVAVKVASSWLVAVAILAATLPIVPTPGYVPDHME